MKLQSFCNEFSELAKGRIKYFVLWRSVPPINRSWSCLKPIREASLMMDSSFFRAEESIFSRIRATRERTGEDLDYPGFGAVQPDDGEQVEREWSPIWNGFWNKSRSTAKAIFSIKGLLSEVCIAAARYYFRVTGDEFGLGKSVDQILDDVYRLTSMNEASAYLTSFIGNIKTMLEAGRQGVQLRREKGASNTSTAILPKRSIWRPLPIILGWARAT